MPNSDNGYNKNVHCVYIYQRTINTMIYERLGIKMNRL